MPRLAASAASAPMNEEELLEQIRKLREEIDARGGIDASPETIEALIQEGRRR